MKLFYADNSKLLEIFFSMIDPQQKVTGRTRSLELSQHTNARVELDPQILGLY
jgi:hypothetical protein